MNIINTIAAAGYLATVENVELLAHEHAVSAEGLQGTGSTYLSVLIAAVQKQVHEGRRRRITAVDALNSVHEVYYAAVIKGVTELDTDSREASRRATFARTAKSTLMSYLVKGGLIGALVPGQTSKAFLRAAIAPAESEDKNKRVIARAEGMLVRTIKKLAKRDRAEAMRSLMGVVDDLTKELDALETDAVEATVKQTRLIRSEVRAT